MGVFSWNDDHCINCKESYNLNLCDGDGCTNKMCQTHTHSLNGNEYCNACYQLLCNE